MKRYRSKKITGGPIEGFVIYDPDGNTLYDIHPETVVQELNKQLLRIDTLENENDAMRATIDYAVRQCQGVLLQLEGSYAFIYIHKTNGKIRIGDIRNSEQIEESGAWRHVSTVKAHIVLGNILELSSRERSKYIKHLLQ